MEYGSCELFSDRMEQILLYLELDCVVCVVTCALALRVFSRA